jgi:DNA repair protein RadC
MNLTLLDRPQLEAIVLNPSSESQQPLVCSDNAVLDYIPAPSTAREGRLRHVLAAAHELLTRIAAEAVKGRSLIDSPSVMKDFLRVYFAGAERETFVVVFLDANHRVIEVEELFAGTLTQTSVYPREVVKRALHFNAAAVCLSHVHPSSQTEPSRADEFLTATLRQALSLVDIRIIDHIIAAANGSSLTSMAERGLL